VLKAGWLKIAVVEARGQFGILEDGESLPLEAVTRGLVKTAD
jgi:hypothetical protein